MSATDEFFIFCQNYGLPPEKPRTWECYRREVKGLPWDIEGDVTECPDCGKQSFKAASSFCFYCGQVETFDGEGVTLTPEQQQAEKQLRAEKAAENKAKALLIWNEADPVGSNNTVATYFSARRLGLPPDPDAVMRWHPRCPYGGGGNREPCIVSLFRDCITDEPTAIHRTWIVSASRGESERRALGPFYGSAIKLWPLAKGGETLAIGEGIETVLAAVALSEADPPAWAATVAGNLSRVPVIRGVKQLTILADNDPHQKGQHHAQVLRKKWLDRNREVEAKKPTKVKDFNDVLIRRGTP